ncbi:MAG: penicillin-binding protein activator [Candidatus Pelagadaptatus aseana]
MLEQAQQSISPKKEQLLLQAAAALYQQQELHWARNLLQSIPPSVLDDQDFIRYTLLFSDIALADDSFFLAERILTEPRLDKLWTSIEPQDQITLRQRRADIFLILGEPDASVRERLALHPLLNISGITTSGTQPALDLSNHNALWRTLMSMPLPELKKRSETSANLELRGWYQLALISKDSQSNLEKQQANIELWRLQWAGHPASVQLPSDLQLLQQLIAERPRRVAIMLPQQGPLSRAANAIRNGFMAAHYQAIVQGNQVPIIDFYDTASGDVVETLYTAASNGAELAVGPLSKNNVASLHQMDSLPLPTLAVNYIDQASSEAPANLFQFGLSAEDEARQIAQRAWVEGHRNALILGTDANWGKRSADAFSQVWEEFGGTIVSTDFYARQKDYSSVIKGALNVSGSEIRYRQLRDVLNQRMEFEPRRRQDVDMIFLIARHDDARQIKPTLDFHYASDLPVYASSHIYTGKSDRKQDRDLNGIRFTTLPWFFDDDSAEKQLIQQAANPAPSYQRLYALGVDSYHLYPRLRQMQEIPDTKLYGVTGSLSLNQAQRIEREQIWAQMRGGAARLLPLTVSH